MTLRCQLRNLALSTLAVLVAVAAPSRAEEERSHTEEELKVLQSAGDLGEAAANVRPAKLPDLTKGDPTGERVRQNSWMLGPTGVVGYMPGGLKGDQIEVTSVAKGSPAEGKLQWGDVILGVAGRTFTAGGNMGILLGNAIIEAEKPENNGQLKLAVWRDSNFIKRNQKKDIAGVDVDRLIDKAVGDDSLYDWKSTEAREKELRSSNFKDFPIVGETIEVTLALGVMPPYSDTSPYDCPKAAKILENAWKVLEKQFKPDERGRGGKGGTIQAVALAASGKPEHRKLLREWVRSPRGRVWHPPTTEDDPLRIPGKSWYMSFTGLDCALYYEATRDEFVLPALTRFAVRTARGQAGNGTWGHNWAQPSFNGGKLHGMNPGYGALNASGNRCFFLLVLAQKLGIRHPEIEAAIGRSREFFGSYIDKGAIPYGHHGAASSDDSNGKNSGVAYALKLLGDHYGAKYFAQMSTHASFSRRGGHGHDWFWHWSPYAASLCGPRGTIASHRNLRWWFTLCRRFDGGFAVHSPTGAKDLRDATATYVLHYAAPLKQTLITGKDADESLWWSDKEFTQLMASARGQMTDPVLLEQAGKPWPQRSTDELFDLLSIFKPKARAQIAGELAKRYKAGETEILPRFVELLSSDNARLRGAACVGLALCGPDETLKHMSGVARLLADPHEFVRMQAARTMSKASSGMDTQIALLKATIADDANYALSPNSLPAFTQNALFGNDTKLATRPFDAGIDEELVQAALEKLITLDPTGNRGMMGSRQKVWDRDTAVRVAGPLVFAAEEEQIGDQMFSGRREWTLGYLHRLGCQEAVDASISYLRKYEALPPEIRVRVDYKRGLVKGKVLMAQPAAAQQYLPVLKRWLADKPLAVAYEAKDEPCIRLFEVIDALEAVKEPKTLPSLGDEAQALFNQKLAATGDPQAKLALCRKELADLHRKTYFRKMAAMSYLADTAGEAAFADLLPYLTHEHWRLQAHAHRLAVKLAEAHGDAKMIAAFGQADEDTAAALLGVLGRTKTKDARKVIEESLGHDSPVVVGAAVEALVAMSGPEAIDKVFGHLLRSPDPHVQDCCRRALLSYRGDPAPMDRIRTWAVSHLPAIQAPTQRRMLYWILGQLGGPKSIAALQDATVTKDDGEFHAAVWALSFCPDPAADKALLDIIKVNQATRRAGLAATEGIRRMVIGADDIGNRPIEEQLDYAQAVLNMELNEATISYLGRIRTGRCAFILQKAMRRGATKAAARAIIDATSDLSGAPEADRKLGVSALIDTIEFIEVTFLRGGASEQLDTRHEAWRDYAMWKAFSAQAGKNLLKLNRTEKAPLPTFDEMDLDL